MNLGEKIFSSNTKLTYTIIHCLSNGGQAEVAFAKADKTDTTYCIKRLFSIKYTSDSIVQKQCKKFEEERTYLYKKINKFTMPGASCSYVCDFFRENSFYYVVTEKINGIELPPEINKVLSIDEILFLFRMIIYAFKPFEINSIIHSDIKPENILLKPHGHYFVPKILDFESAFYYKSPPIRGSIVGTEPYYSPELASYNDVSVEHTLPLTFKSDIFALGIILYKMLMGTYPIPKEKKKYLFEVIANSESIYFPHEWSKELKNLLLSMWSLDPEKRPCIDHILETLKSLNDFSYSPNSIIEPHILIDRINDHKSSVSVITLNKNIELEYSIDRNSLQHYTKPFFITDDDVELEIKIKKIGESETYKFTRIISASSFKKGKVAKPKIHVEKGFVTITCSTPNANIYYTINNQEPDKYSNKYSEPFKVAERVIIKCYARCIGMHQSDVVSINSSSKLKIS